MFWDSFIGLHFGLEFSSIQPIPFPPLLCTFNPTGTWGSKWPAAAYFITEYSSNYRCGVKTPWLLHRRWWKGAGATPPTPLFWLICWGPLSVWKRGPSYNGRKRLCSQFFEVSDTKRAMIWPLKGPKSVCGWNLMSSRLRGFGVKNPLFTAITSLCRVLKWKDQSTIPTFSLSFNLLVNICLSKM